MTNEADRDEYSVVLKRLRDKYYEFDLTGISDEQLIANEARHEPDEYTMYPLLDEHDALSATGKFAKWSNHEGGQITIDLGSLGNETNIHAPRKTADRK